MNANGLCDPKDGFVRCNFNKSDCRCIDVPVVMDACVNMKRMSGMTDDQAQKACGLGMQQMCSLPGLAPVYDANCNKISEGLCVPDMSMNACNVSKNL